MLRITRKEESKLFEQRNVSVISNHRVVREKRYGYTKPKVVQSDGVVETTWFRGERRVDG